MVRPQELIEGVLYSLQQCPDLPDSTNFVGYEPDIESEAIKLPLVEVSTGPHTNASLVNSDFVGVRENSDGQVVARVYESLYSLELNIAVWTAHGSKFSPRDLSDTVRDVLYAHQTSGPDKDLRHPDGSTIDEVWNFQLLEGQQTDDLATSPTLRRWQQDISVSASEQYVTQPDESPIETVDFDDVNTSLEFEDGETEITVSSGDTQ